MSVCRWSRDSDVYVYYDVAGGITCCGCTLSGVDTPRFNASDEDAMITHLLAHKAKGHAVPSYALDGLRCRREARIIGALARLGAAEGNR